MGEQDVVRTRNGILCSLKKDGRSDTGCNVDEAGGLVLREIMSRKDKYCMTPLPGGPGSRQIQRQLMVGTSGWGRGWGLSVSWAHVSVWDDKQVLELGGGDGRTATGTVLHTPGVRA